MQIAGEFADRRRLIAARFKLRFQHETKTALAFVGTRRPVRHEHRHIIAGDERMIADRRQRAEMMRRHRHRAGRLQIPQRGDEMRGAFARIGLALESGLRSFRKPSIYRPARPAEISAISREGFSLSRALLPCRKYGGNCADLSSLKLPRSRTSLLASAVNRPQYPLLHSFAQVVTQQTQARHYAAAWLVFCLVVFMFISDRSTHTNYRPEIDGLRAIAVLAVVFYHAGIPGFTGGFVGVDVFFVISGYLITGIIWAGVQNGSFSLQEFYVRRIKRLFSALSRCFSFPPLRRSRS